MPNSVVPSHPGLRESRELEFALIQLFAFFFQHPQVVLPKNDGRIKIT
jgi:hypothetical protein